MYLPKQFEVSSEEAWRLIDAEPFATLIAHGAGAPLVSHLPLVASDGRLLGHMARQNPQWQMLETAPKVTAIFHGPHAYVTPLWYASPDVPTWNYAVVHVEGTVRLLSAPRDLMRVLALMTDKFEGQGDGAWRLRLPDDLAGEGRLAQAIVAFEIEVTRVSAKFKLSQNRSSTDRHGVIDGLEKRGDGQSLGVVDLMRRLT